MGIEFCRRCLPLAIFLTLAGCGEQQAGPTVYPVSGKIVVDGKPAAKAQVTFYPTSGATTQILPIAQTDADGAFRPSTWLTGDGAPAGHYTLSILWSEIKLDHGEEVAGRDRLGNKYSNPQTSPLKVTIRPGENSLPPFQLRSSR